MHDERPAVFNAVYTQPYNEVVQPGQVWKISKYFLRRWTPYLTPSQVWLVIGARQLSYFNQRRPWFRAYDATLAQAAGQHVKVFRRTTKKDIVAGTGPIATFMTKEADPVYYRDDAVTRQSETRYRVRLDDPLTPGDATALAFWLRRNCPERITPETVHELLRTATQLPAYILRAADPSPVSAEAPGLLSVADVVTHVFPAVGGAGTTWCETADALHTHVVAPEYAHFDMQYFRRRWLPELGPGPALLLTYLRSLCYYNEETGETRDEVTLETGDLESVLQVSSRTLRRWFQRIEEAVPPDNLLGVFYSARHAVKQPDQKVATTYWVNLKMPLVAADLGRYQQRIRTGSCDEADEKFPTTIAPHGQKVPHAIGGDGQNVPTTAKGDGQIVPHAIEGNGQEVPGTTGGGRQKVGGSATKEGDYKYYRTLAQTLGLDSFEKFLAELPASQQHLWHAGDGRATEPFAAVAVRSLEGLLNWLAIQEPARGQILAAGVPLDVAVAWTLYTLDEPGLENPAGYLVRRLRAGDAPPPTFLQLAHMSWEQWRAYAAACYLAFQGGLTLFAGDEAFAQWREQYGTFRLDELPFAAGAGIAELPPPTLPHQPAPDGAPAGAVVPADRALWRAVLDELSLQMTQTTFNSWLRDAHLLAREGDQFVVAVRDEAALDWLEHRLQEPIVRTLRSISDEPAAAVTFVTASPHPGT